MILHDYTSHFYNSAVTNSVSLVFNYFMQHIDAVSM